MQAGCFCGGLRCSGSVDTVAVVFGCSEWEEEKEGEREGEGWREEERERERERERYPILMT